MKLKGMLLLAGLLALWGPAAADELLLKNGERLQGTVTAFDGTTYTIQTRYGALKVPRTDLAKAIIDNGGGPASPGAGPALTDGTVGGGSAAAPAPPAPEGALAHWGLDGTCADGSGRHPGTIKGQGEWQADRQGRPNSALRFHGRSEETVTVAHSPELAPDRITISAWVRGDKPQRWARIVDKLNWSAKSGYALIHHEAKHVFALDAFGEGGKRIWVESRSVVSPAWTHVAVTYDGRTARIFINGALENEAESGAVLKHNDKALTLGGGFDGNNHFPWSGDLDDIRIFGRALSAREIEVLFREQDGPDGVTDLMHRDRI